jgi:hypothetical protein
MHFGRGDLEELPERRLLLPGDGRIEESLTINLCARE